MCCPQTGVNSQPRANMLFLPLDFGAVFIVWKRSSALGSELRTELKVTSFPSAAHHVCDGLGSVSGDLLLFFLAQGKNGSGHNKYITSFAFTFHSLLSHPGTGIVRRPVGWGQPNRAVNV